MKPTEKEDKLLHSKLPIGLDEKIIGVYKHHFVAYLVPLILAVITIVVLIVVALVLTTYQFTDGTTMIGTQYNSYIFMALLLFSVLVLAFSYIPMWMKTQEQLVLTNEVLLQVLQPSLFSDRVDQVSLQHVANISVRQDFFGNLFGYGTITIETPGEQNNFLFAYLPHPNAVANEIAEAHEAFIVALENGYIPSSRITTGSSRTISPS